MYTTDHPAQFPAALEHLDAVIVNASYPLVAVMGHETALMAVMRLDVVSYYKIFICILTPQCIVCMCCIHFSVSKYI